MDILAFHFRPKLWSMVKTYRGQDFLSDFAAGITVGIVALPLAMAFAIASGLKPEVGIYTAITGGIIVSLLGGSRVQIGGPAGAFIVLVYGIVAQYGVAGLLIATLLSGVLLFLMGVLRWGSLIRFVPVGVVIGVTNGIAVQIAVSQLGDLFGLKIDKLSPDFFPKLATLWAHVDSFDLTTALLSLGSLVILFGWPVCARASRLVALQRIPGSIIALIVATLATRLLHLPVATIGTRFGGIPSTLPGLTLPAINLTAVQGLLVPAITLALLGAIESLLCARVADGLIDDRHDPNQELMAQGIANIVAPLLGGYCVTGTIARTVTNIRAGGVSPVAGVIHGLTLLAIVAVAAPLASGIPLAALAATLLYVAYNMGEWHEFARLKNFTNSYRFNLLVTFALTVAVDLTVAVLAGLGFAFLFFIRHMAEVTQLEHISADEARGHARLGGAIEAYRLSGMLFFGAVHRLESLLDPARSTPKIMVLNLRRLLNIDATGLEAFENLQTTLHKRGCRLLLAGLHGQPLRFMTKAGFIAELGGDNLFDTTAHALDFAASQQPR